MALKKQNISFPILKGLQQNVHKWLVPEGQLTSGYNLEFDEEGTARARDGFKNVGTVDIDGNAPSDNLTRLAVREDELVCIGQDRVYSYDADLSRFVDRDDPPTCRVGEVRTATEDDVVSTSSFQYPTSAAVNGFLCTAWQSWDEDNGDYSLEIVIQSISTGSVVLRTHRTAVGTGFRYPKVIAIEDTGTGNYYFVWTANRVTAGGGTIDVVGNAILVSAAGFETGWIHAGYTTLHSGGTDDAYLGVYDISVGQELSGDDGIWLVTRVSTGTKGLYMYLFKYDLSSSLASNVFASAVAFKALSCSGYPGSANMALGYIDDSGNRIHLERWYNSGGSITNSFTASWDSSFDDTADLAISVILASSGNYWCAWSGMGNDGNPDQTDAVAYTGYRKYNTAGSLQGSERVMYNVFLADQLFENDGWLYHVGYEYDEWSNKTWTTAGDSGITVSPYWDGTSGYADDTRFAFVLLGIRDDSSHTADTAKPHPMALSCVGRAIGRTYPGNTLQFLGAGTQADSSTFYSAQRYLMENTRGKSTYSGLKGITNLSYDFSDVTKIGSSSIGSLLLVGGGLVSVYDGDRLAETQFCWIPRVVWGGYNATAATGLKSTGILDYVFTYEVYTREGRRIQSAPSAVWSVDRATYTNDEVAFNVVQPTLTNWCDEDSYLDTRAFISMYRRETSTGPFYFVQRQYVPFDQAATATLVQMVDDGAAGDYDANERLYTLPGSGISVLENLPIPGGHILAAHDNRVFVVSGEDPSKVNYSNQLLDGRGIEFTLLYIQAAAPITGLASMDNVLVMFSNRSTFVIPGRGPGATGLPADGFGQIQTISSTIGCIDHRSIVMTPLGVMFQSRDGLKLLDRGLSISPIGEGIQDELDDYPYILRAVLYEAKGQVVFLVTDSDPPVAGTTGFRRLVYHYDADKWSYDKFGFEENTITHATLDTAVLGNRLYMTERTALLRQYHCPIEVSGPPTKNDAIGPGTPATHSFTGYLETAWLKMGNLQDFKRVWRVRVLGETADDIPAAGLDPHAVKVHLFHDYDETKTTYTWDKDTIWGLRNTNGGPLSRGGKEQFEIHNPKQKCQSLKVGVEIYDCQYAFGVRIVGVDFEVGLKRGGFKNLPAALRT